MAGTTIQKVEAPPPSRWPMSAMMHAWLCARFGLTSEQVIRHYDVTGKECPKYYVDHPDAWEQMKADISAQITIDQGLMGIS